MVVNSADAGAPADGSTRPLPSNGGDSSPIPGGVGAGAGAVVGSTEPLNLVSGSPGSSLVTPSTPVPSASAFKIGSFGRFSLSVGDDPVEGVITAVEPSKGLVVLQHWDNQSHSRVRIVNLKFVKEVQVSEVTDPFQLSSSKRFIMTLSSIDAANSRIKSATKKLDSRFSNSGVTELGMAVFDELSKTLPCRWDMASIIVEDCYRVDPPSYDSVSPISSNAHSDAMQYMNKMLRGFFERRKQS